MCGINGIINLSKKNSKEELINKILAMNNSINHRGPDGEGYVINEANNIILGNRRLAIVGDDNINQPIVTNNFNIITYNGEIYNYKELQNKLINENNANFETNTDTEVIIKCYEQFGIDFINKIDGMYAFCIWDEKNKKAILSKDFFGKKPLYYCLYNDDFYFSSEINALKKVLPQSFFEISNYGLVDYFKYGYINGKKTIYKNILKLEPNSCIEIYNKNIRERKFENRPINDEYKFIQKKDLEDLFNQKFSNAVRKRTNSSKKMSLLLSGGIDSTLIALEMKKQELDFSSTHISIEKNEDKIILDNLKTMKKNGMDINFLNISNKEILQDYDKIIKNFSEPNSDISIIPTYFAYKNSGTSKIVLNGDGADELFFGYRRINLAKFISYYLKDRQLDLTSIKILDNKLFNAIALPLLDKIHCLSGNFVTKQERNTILNNDFINNYNDKNIFNDYSGKSFFDILYKFDIDQQLPNCLLVKSDMCSMLNSKEARSPMLDKDIYELSLHLKNKYFFSEIQDKKLLRKSLKNKISNNLYKLPKKGFDLNKRNLYEDNYKTIRETISTNSTIYNLINKNQLIKYMDSTQYKNSDLLWSIYSFISWENQ